MSVPPGIRVGWLSHHEDDDRADAKRTPPVMSADLAWRISANDSQVLCPHEASDSVRSASQIHFQISRVSDMPWSLRETRRENGVQPVSPGNKARRGTDDVSRRRATRTRRVHRSVR